MKKLYALLLTMAFASPAFAQVAIPVTNAATTGTVLNETAIVNSSNDAVVAATTNTTVPAYIVIAGAGTAGQSQLAITGPAPCIMDSTIANAAGWFFVVNSTTVAGDCHAQSATPSAGTWVVGYLDSSSTTAGSAAQVDVTPFVFGGAGSGGSSGFPITLGSTSVAAGSTITSISGLTLASPTMTGTINAGGATQFKLPTVAGYTTSAAGEIGYDTSLLNWHVNIAGQDNFMATLVQTPTLTNGDCPELEEVGEWWELQDSGHPCGTSSSGGATLAANTFTGPQTAPSFATDGSGVAGAYVQENAAGTASTTWTTGATTSNTIAGFATVPVTGDLIDCIVSTSPTCQLTDTGVLASAVASALTTSGTGAATLSGHTLNVPTPTLSALGGAPLASPAFTGTPTAPTAATGTNTTQVATTAFVLANAGSGGGGTTTDALTLNNGGAGAASGTTFNGSAPVTLSFNTIGAQQALTLTNTGTSGPATLLAGALNIPDYNSGGTCTGTDNEVCILNSSGVAVTTPQIFVSPTSNNIGFETTTPVQTFEFAGTRGLEVPLHTTTYAVTSGTCSSTAATCTITGGAALGVGPGVVILGYGAGSTLEAACFTAATSTSITFGDPNSNVCSTTGRGIWGSTAQSIGSGENILLLVDYSSNGPATPPNFWLGQDGNLEFDTAVPTANNVQGEVVAFDTSIFSNQGYFLGNSNGSARIGAINTSGSGILNGDSNYVLLTNSNTASRNVATQSITSTGTFASTATAITAAKTVAYPANSSAASATVSGQMEADCEIFWQQSTAVSTAQFGVSLSAAVTSLTVLDEDFNGTTVTSSSPTVVTAASTATPTSPVITPSTTGTTNWTHMRLIMNPGTTTAPVVSLFANSGSASDAVVIQPQTGCTSWH
jgi:hypothetical protein